MTGPRWTWALAGLLAALGLVAALVRPTAPAVSDVAAAAVLTSFPPAVLERVAAWTGPIRVAFVLRTLLTLALPVAVVATPAGRRLVDRLAGERFATLRGALVPQVVGVLASLPFVWWISWHHAGEFGFRTAGPIRFVLETAGGIGLSLLVSTTTVLLLLWLVRRRPDDWAAVGTLLGTALTAVLFLVQPLVVTELLYDPQPLADGPQRDVVEAVVARSALPATELLVGEASVRTTRVNAFVTGIGPSQRVVLFDTLLGLPERRIAAVVGHELAHAEHLDLPRAVLASAFGILVALGLAQWWLQRRPDAAAAPLRGGRAGAVVAVALLVAQVGTSPVVAWQSRRVEAAADARALELVRDPAGMVELQRGFVTDDLVDPFPPAWVRLFGSHPAVGERIERAAAFAEQEDLPLDVDALVGE